MKLLQWLSLPLAALYASAQGIYIAAPANGSSIQAGSNFTVEIDQPVRVSQFTIDAHTDTLFFNRTVYPLGSISASQSVSLLALRIPATQAATHLVKASVEYCSIMGHSTQSSDIQPVALLSKTLQSPFLRMRRSARPKLAWPTSLLSGWVQLPYIYISDLNEQASYGPSVEPLGITVNIV